MKLDKHELRRRALARSEAATLERLAALRGELTGIARVIDRLTLVRAHQPPKLASRTQTQRRRQT
jgi:hypothetical protein